MNEPTDPRLDPELTNWIFAIPRLRAGDFLRSVAEAAIRADDENYRILRPALLRLKAKYPKYDVPIPEGEQKFPPSELAMEQTTVIPPITHPLGIHWDQPSTSEILLDDKYAVMPLRVFQELSEYSATNPTGVYEGKMWKRHDGAFDRAFIARGGKPIWLLCWYGPSSRPGYVSNHSRKILIA
jgi:hypothetical protein